MLNMVRNVSHRPLCLALAALLIPVAMSAQMLKLTRDQMISLTSENPFDRFADGRPRVPDELLKQVNSLAIEEAYPLVTQKGFPNQFEGNWKVLNSGKKLVGRAFTVQFMPARPDVQKGLQAAADAGGLGQLRNQTVIDMLGPNDVVVVDLFGKTEGGTFVGDKLAYYIWKTTGTGVVIDGAMFYLRNIMESGMPAYYRNFHPRSLGNVMITGINVPIRIGNATVMPGDVVLGDEDGLFFIPPHLVKPVVDAAASTHIRDEWMKRQFDKGKYKSGEIYSRPKDPALQKELEEYIKERQAKRP